MGRPDRAPLQEKVEVDEAYVGGPEVGLRGGRELRNKALVVVEVRSRAAGRVRLHMIPDASGQTLMGFVRAIVVSGQ